MKVGNFLMKNKGKIALALVTIAAAEAANRLIGARLRRHLEKNQNSERTASAPDISSARIVPRRKVHDIYHAPQIPKQNLMRH